MGAQEGTPPPRIGDAERDEAVTLLQQHMAAGRLDEQEFAERMSTALTARTQADLDSLFVDLPGDKPGHVNHPAPRRPSGWGMPDRRRTGLIMISVAVAVIVVMTLAVAGLYHPLMFLVVPIVVAFGFRRDPWPWGRH